MKLIHAQKHLDLQLDNKLTLNEYTSNNISKKTKRIEYLRRLLPILPRRSLLFHYKSFTKPHFYYGDVNL